jgi:RimJ/RimL family protein N-acetyltransferase
MSALPLRSHMLVRVALTALLALTTASTFLPRHPCPRPLIGASRFGTLGARVRKLVPSRTRLPMTAIVCETPRLVLRSLGRADAGFILRLVNDPDWLRFIGDRNVHDLHGARRYISEGPAAMRKRHGFALDVVERKEDGAPMGLCGLIKRDMLDDVDLGFAFLPEFRGQGYAHEACVAVLERAAREFVLRRVAAITAPDNERSMKLLGALGFEFVRLLRMAPDDRGARLYLRALDDMPA